ncbi:acetamidase/formamidase family protein [Rhizohabitans arisaemae]|uniref:acetamidase/formamidase family protein n=1 Tax=Rhizohabitans arisaemae TaxID=2720610 RepID=UPI0024B19C4E|nr:acetamidase/formamidase family protein [Rhizohabitans arisaemae]
MAGPGVVQADPPVIGLDHTHGHFSAEIEPGLAVTPGQRFVVRAASLLTNPLFGKSDEYERMAIPITGPIHVTGAVAGATLRVDIHRIGLADRGAMVTIPGRGAFGGAPLGRYGRTMEISGGFVHFDEDTRIPVDPMVGKIGVAVPGPPPVSSTVGTFGGNLDCREIRAGCSVFLPVQVDGAYLYVGDLHAAQGDGECSMTAVEVEGEVELSCSLVPEVTLERPMLVTPTSLFTIGDGDDLDAAARTALDDMLALVTGDRGWSREKAAMFLSAAADVAVCQIVNPRASARAGVLLDYLRSRRLRETFRPLVPVVNEREEDA